MKHSKENLKVGGRKAGVPQGGQRFQPACGPPVPSGQEIGGTHAGQYRTQAVQAS